MQLTEHFSLEEMTHSQSAIRHGIENKPNPEQEKNLVALCTKVLEPLREQVGAIKIDSGFRSTVVNSIIGGVSSSQHTKGEAADTIPFHYPLKDYYNLIKVLVSQGKLTVDQCIYEFDSWVHISYSQNNRNEFLIATKENGHTIYRKDII